MENNVLAYAASIFSQFLFNSPNEKEWQNIKENKILLEWFLHSNNNISNEASKLWEESHNNEEYLDLAVDFTNLFICDEMSLKAPPYSSFYLDITGELYSNECDKIKSLYNRCSFFSNKLFEDSADHISTEFEFLSTLLYSYEKNEDFKEVLKPFLETHFIPWVSVWVKDIQNNATSSFYKGIGFLIEDYLDILTQEFDIKDIKTPIFRKAS